MREQFLEDPLATAIATRGNRPPDDIDARLLAAATAAVLRIGIERWVTTGATPGTLRPLVDDAFKRIGREMRAST